MEFRLSMLSSRTSEQIKDRTIKWQYFTINLIRQNLKRLSEKALFLPRGVKSFPGTAVQGQHPDREGNFQGGGEKSVMG